MPSKDEVQRGMGMVAENSHRSADWQINRGIIGTTAELILALIVATDYADGGVTAWSGLWYSLIAAGLAVEFFERISTRYQEHKKQAESFGKSAGPYA